MLEHRDPLNRDKYGRMLEFDCTSPKKPLKSGTGSNSPVEPDAANSETGLPRKADVGAVGLVPPGSPSLPIAFPESFEHSLQQFESNISIARGSHSVFFPGLRAKFIDKQIAHKDAQYRRAEQIVTREFNLHNLPRHLMNAEENVELTHKQVVATARLLEATTSETLKTIEVARAKGTTAAVFVAGLQGELTNRLLNEKADADLDRELRRDRELKQAEREHEAQQASSYITTCTQASLAERQRQKQLYGDLDSLTVREYEIEVSDKPLPVKAGLLKNVRDQMLSVRNQLNGIEEAYRKADSRQAFNGGAQTGTDT